MNIKIRNRFVICGGTMVALLAGALLQHQVTIAPAPQIRPVYDFVPVGKNTPPPVSEAAGVEPILPENDTLTPPMSDASPELQPIAEPEETSKPQPSPVAQAQSTLPPLDEPQMGDTRTVDGQKRVYFLGFGWIEDNDTPNECVYAEDMYENGNKVGSMGGGEVGRSCGDINKMVGTMD